MDVWLQLILCTAGHMGIYISLSVYWFEKHILRPDRVVSKRPLGAVRVVDSVGRVTVYGRR